jgi:hypothetical protein
LLLRPAGSRPLPSWSFNCDGIRVKPRPYRSHVRQLRDRKHPSFHEGLFVGSLLNEFVCTPVEKTTLRSFLRL